MNLETNPLLVPWNDLPENIKESNRRQADDIGKKLKTVHCDMEPLTNWDAELFEFTPEESEIMAAMEHQRWLNERRNEGWTYDPGPKNLECMTSPALLDWEELPESKKIHIPFFPNFLMRDLLIWLIIINILSILAVFFPWELGKKAEELASAPAGIRPEWYFLFMFQILKLIPAKVIFIEGEVFGVIMFGLAGLFWFLVPFWDRKTPRGKKWYWLNYVGLLVIIFIIVFTIIGFIT